MWTISCERTNEQTGVKDKETQTLISFRNCKRDRVREWVCVFERERERERRERMCERKKRIKVKNIGYFYIDSYEYPTST